MTRAITIYQSFRAPCSANSNPLFVRGVACDGAARGLSDGLSTHGSTRLRSQKSVWKLISRSNNNNDTVIKYPSLLWISRCQLWIIYNVTVLMQCVWFTRFSAVPAYFRLSKFYEWVEFDCSFWKNYCVCLLNIERNFSNARLRIK